MTWAPSTGAHGRPQGRRGHPARGQRQEGPPGKRHRPAAALAVALSPVSLSTPQRDNVSLSFSPLFAPPRTSPACSGGTCLAATTSGGFSPTRSSSRITRSSAARGTGAFVPSAAAAVETPPKKRPQRLCPDLIRQRIRGRAGLSHYARRCRSGGERSRTRRSRLRPRFTAAPPPSG